MEIINRQVHHNYFIISTYESGIVLTGTEIKSIRQGKCNIKDSYATIKNGEVYLLNSHISTYDKGNIFNHDERRERKLLLHKEEILKLQSKISLMGYTLIPIRIYFIKNRVKVLIGLCKGKKTFNKKESIKERDLQRDMLKDQN